MISATRASRLVRFWPGDKNLAADEFGPSRKKSKATVVNVLGTSSTCVSAEKFSCSASLRMMKIRVDRLDFQLKSEGAKKFAGSEIIRAVLGWQPIWP